MTDYIIIGLLAILILAVVVLIMQIKSLKEASKGGQDNSRDELRSLESQIRKDLGENRREMSQAMQNMNSQIVKGQMDMMKSQAEQSEKMYSHMSTQTKEINETLSIIFPINKVSHASSTSVTMSCKLDLVVIAKRRRERNLSN